MMTREIVQNDWEAFFDHFSRQHENWLVRLDVLGAEIGAQHEVVESPLIGVSTGAPTARTVYVHAGRGSEHVTHTVPHVAHVRLEQSAEGTAVALQIESTDGTTALLQFRPGAQGETEKKLRAGGKARKSR